MHVDQATRGRANATGRGAQGVLRWLAAGVCLAALAGCHPAREDYASCVAQASDAAAGAGEGRGGEVSRCMAARGWRAVRPHLEPGSNGWVRVRD